MVRGERRRSCAFLSENSRHALTQQDGNDRMKQMLKGWS